MKGNLTGCLPGRNSGIVPVALGGSGKMKETTDLANPPPFQLPHASLKSGLGLESPSAKKQEKFAAKYDTFHGILKRVYDMKLSGSLDSEEPGTESERSESSASHHSKRQILRSGSFFCSNGSFFEDGSSTGSTSGSDRCSPQEEEVSRDVLRSSRSRVTTDSRQAPVAEDVGGLANSSADDRASLEEGNCDEEVISETEKHQMEMFFRSLKTEVFVCESLVHLYAASKENGAEWTHRHTGVAVVILDSGDARSRSKRRIQILLAERGTCFPLWKDTIDNLSAYHKSNAAFHTMHLSSDHGQIVGLSFLSPSEADKLFRHIEWLTSNPENINISVPGSGKRGKSPRKKNRLPLALQKKQISNPCLFQHVISISAGDKPVYVSLQTLIKSDAIKKEESIQ